MLHWRLLPRVITRHGRGRITVNGASCSSRRIRRNRVPRRDRHGRRTTGGGGNLVRLNRADHRSASRRDPPEALL
jgi:hypothetical protein